MNKIICQEETIKMISRPPKLNDKFSAVNGRETLTQAGY